MRKAIVAALVLAVGALAMASVYPPIVTWGEYVTELTNDLGGSSIGYDDVGPLSAFLSTRQRAALVDYLDEFGTIHSAVELNEVNGIGPSATNQILLFYTLNTAEWNHDLLSVGSGSSITSTTDLSAILAKKQLEALEAYFENGGSTITSADQLVSISGIGDSSIMRILLFFSLDLGEWGDGYAW